MKFVIAYQGTQRFIYSIHEKLVMQQICPTVPITAALGNAKLICEYKFC